MTKTLSLSLAGDAAIIDAGLDSFCRGSGWSDTSGVSQEQWARDRLRDYIHDTAAAWNAQQASEQARQAAINQTATVLGTLTLTLSVE